MLIISFAIVVYFCIKRSNYHDTVIFLASLTIGCGLICAGWVTYQNHLVDTIAGNASVVAYNDNNSIYYDETKDEYFFVNMGLWDLSYSRVVLNHAQAEYYVYLSDQMAELPLNKMIE